MPASRGQLSVAAAVLAERELIIYPVCFACVIRLIGQLYIFDNVIFSTT